MTDLPTLKSLQKPVCECCQDELWVCENHADKPWNEKMPGGCKCGAGMPLPSPPGAELNFSNEAERDAVSLKPDTSSQPASEAGKLSTDTGEEA